MSTERRKRIERPLLFIPGAVFAATGTTLGIWAASMLNFIYNSDEGDAFFGIFIAVPAGFLGIALIAIGTPLIIKGLQPKDGNSTSKTIEPTDAS